jgi:chromosome segregation ATPase
MNEDKILDYLVNIQEHTKEVPKIAERIAIVETSLQHLGKEQLELHQEQKELEAVQSTTAETLRDVQVAIAQTNARCDSRTQECANRTQIEAANISGRWKAVASIAGALVALLIASFTAIQTCNGSSEAAEPHQNEDSEDNAGEAEGTGETDDDSPGYGYLTP